MTVWIGLMSGTSLDGVDAAAVRMEGDEERPDEAELVAFRTRAYEPAFRGRLERACREAGPGELCALGVELGRRFARAVHALAASGLDLDAAAAVGSHGQTLWHGPPAPGGGDDREGGPEGGGREAVACTLQVGEAAVIAEETGLPVVSDFRVRDVAAGGQGAPLTPYFDRLLLAAPDRSRAILNLGGMGNVTVLPREDSAREPVAFDTGPGTALVDAAYRRLVGDGEGFDRDGAVAARGTVSEEGLAWWLDDPFFSAAPPKSTGRERFGPDRLDAWLAGRRGADPADLLATLTELTARGAAGALERSGVPIDEVALCGGGARNRELVRRLEERVGRARVVRLSELGWDPDAREAAAFALLARQHELGIPASPPWATGARGARVLGKRTPA